MSEGSTSFSLRFIQGQLAWCRAILFFNFLFSLFIFFNGGLVFAGVREDIGRAKQLYEKGRLQGAAKLLQRVVRKYPDNRAAYFMLGRVYYKGGQMKDAARFFRRAGVDFVDSSSAFEYGISLFSVKDCDRAQKGFSRVPRTSSQYDVANFYSAVCYSRSRNWHMAENTLRLARRLPSHLMSARRKLLIEVQKRQREERLGGISQSVPYVPFSMAPQQNYYAIPYYQPPVGGLPPGQGAPLPGEYEEEKKAEVKKPEPVKPISGFSFTVTPKVEYLSETYTSNRHFLGEKNITIQGPQGASDFQLRYGFEPDKKGQQTALNLALNLGVRNLVNNSKDVSFVQDENLDGETSQTQTVTIVSDKAFTNEIKPSIAVPLFESFDIEAGGLYGEEYPDYKPDSKIVKTGPFGSLSLGIFDFTSKVNTSLTNLEKVDDEGSIISTDDQSFSATLDGSLAFGLSLNLSASYTETSNPAYGAGSLDGFASTENYGATITKAWESINASATITQSNNTEPAYLEDYVTGTTDQTKSVLQLVKSFKVGLSLTGFFEYTMVNEFIKPGLCASDDEGVVLSCEDGEEKIGVATGTRTGFGVSAKFTPVEWVYGTASWDQKQTVYTVKQVELAADFRRKVPDYVTSMKFLIGVSKSF